MGNYWRFLNIRLKLWELYFNQINLVWGNMTRWRERRLEVWGLLPSSERRFWVTSQAGGKCKEEGLLEGRIQQNQVPTTTWMFWRSNEVKLKSTWDVRACRACIMVILSQQWEENHVCGRRWVMAGRHSR